MPPPCHYVTSSWSSLISQISAVPNQVKALHATEEGNSSHNGNVSVPLLCVTFLGLIRSKYLTQGLSVLALTSVVHLFHSLSFFPLLICNTDDKTHKEALHGLLSLFLYRSPLFSLTFTCSHAALLFFSASHSQTLAPNITARLSVIVQLQLSAASDRKGWPSMWLFNTLSPVL